MIAWFKKQPIGRALLAVCAIALTVLTAVAWFAEPENRDKVRQAVDQQRSHAQAQKKDVPPGGAPKSSEAERIARLQRVVEATTKQLEDAQRRLNDPASEYHRAEAAFTEVDRELAEKSRELQKLKKQGKPAEADALDKGLEPLRKRQQHARDRFDAAIQERKALKEKVATLPAKLERERKALERLTEGTPAEKPAPAKSTKAPPPAGEAGKPTAAATAPPAGKSAGAEEKAEGGKPGKPESQSPTLNRKIKEASDQAHEKEDAARTAHEKADRLTEYLDGLRIQIALDQRLLEAARKKADEARKEQNEQEQERQKRAAAGAGEEELRKLAAEIEDDARRQEEAAADVQEITDRLAEAQESLDRITARRADVVREAEERDREADRAKKKVDDLQNPFTPRNLLQWFLEHGPRLLVVLLGTLLLHRLVIVSSRRIVRLMTRSRRDARLEEAGRAETLVAVFRNTTSMIVLGGGTLMLLDELGIPIVPLMGGAAVFGLAVAFGAQNLIKDYFSGFMVLMEDQYAVNDVIRVGNIEGQVERITLRVTVVRDGNGAAHFIPHGTITTVSNLTHGWSRAFFDIGVAYKEDVDRVMAVLVDLGRGLRQDATFGPLILEDAEMLGVDAFGDSAVAIKFFIKTRPLKQWLVKRELLRRIKRRFDELGIEIPFPHHTVYHRHEAGGPAEGHGDERFAA